MDFSERRTMPEPGVDGQTDTHISTVGWAECVTGFLSPIKRHWWHALNP
jgi:hypothetical protein